MFEKIAVKHLRTGAWLAAGAGILVSFVFHAYESSIFYLPFVGRDILPYFIIAIAATMSRTFALAWISLVASFTVLAVGVYAYFDLIRVPAAVINDIQLFTDPLKWMIALIVLVVAVGSFIYSKIQNAWIK
jgi:hypothetical protein